MTSLSVCSVFLDKLSISNSFPTSELVSQYLLMDSQKKSSLCGQEAAGHPFVEFDSFQSVSDIFDVFDYV